MSSAYASTASGTKISGTSPKSLRCITTQIVSPLPPAGCRILSTMGSPAEGACVEEMLWHSVAPPWELHGVYPSATIRQDHRRKPERGMRWFHEAVDRLHVALLQRMIPPVFQHGIDSPSLAAHLATVQLPLPALTATRHYTVRAHTLIGEVVAGFQVRWGPQPDLPVIVYHHGIAEMPYDKSFRGIFRGSLPGQ